MPPPNDVKFVECKMLGLRNHPLDELKVGGGAVAQWVRALAWPGDWVGSNPTAATSLQNFSNSIYPALPVSFGGDTKAVGPFYLVSMPGEVKDPTSLHGNV